MSAKPGTTPTTEQLLAIASGAVRQGNRFEVRSTSSDKVYHTTAVSCTCPHWQFRGTPCRHMLAVEMLCPAPNPKKFEGDPFQGF